MCEFLLDGLLLLVKDGVEVRITCFFLQSCQLSLDESGVVGFANEEVAQDRGGTSLIAGLDHTKNWTVGDKTYSNRNNPEDPSPADGLHHVSSSNRSNAGTQQGTHRPDSHGLASFLDREHIGDGAAAISDWSRTGEAHQESEGNHHTHILTKSSGDGEDDEEDVGNVEADGAAEDFAHGGGEERAKREAEDVDGDDKGGHVLVVGVELSHDVGDAWGEHRGALAVLVDPLG